MTRVLLIGFDPQGVDYSDPALPKGLTAEKIQAGIDAGLDDFRKRGWEADHCLVSPADAVETMTAAVTDRLASHAYDCVVIGGGIRMPPKSLIAFEAIVNAVHKGAPQAAIAFNTRPEDSGEAAARWVETGQPSP